MHFNIQEIVLYLESCIEYIQAKLMTLVCHTNTKKKV